MKPRSLVVPVFAALLLFSLPAGAAVVTNISTPITLQFFVPCANGGAGETIELSGFLHDLVTTTIDEQGGVHVTEQTNPQNVGGVGLTTGDRYRGTGLTRQEFSTTASGVFEFTFINRFDLIGQGPGNNFSVHETVHTTVLSDGTVTVTFDILSVTCQ